MSSLSTLTKSVTAFSNLKPAVHHHGNPNFKLKIEVFNSCPYQHNVLTLSSSSISCSSSMSKTTARATSVESFGLISSSKTENRHWMVYMERPPEGVNTKSGVINYYVKTLQRVLGSEKDAQMSIYNASWESQFGFCCEIDEELSRELAGLPGVRLVTQDPTYGTSEKDYRFPRNQGNEHLSSMRNPVMLFPAGNTKHWLVRLEKPGIGVVTKAQMVDYYVQLLSKVLENETDAQMCIYHVSWKSKFGFCCELDEHCARQLAGVPGVLSVHPDYNFESDIKDYEVNNQQSLVNALSPAEVSQTTPVKTKKLFITGLSFYTSEKTLRAAFEGFGELVGVKIIMDQISKRSKGYAFVEYTTEEAASAALKEMNGKIINGWMIVVDVAKSNPPKHSRGRPR